MLGLNRRHLLWSLCLMCLLAVPKFVHASGDLGIGLKAVASGKEKPAVKLTPRRALRKVTITLRREDGKTLKLQAKNLKAGRERLLPFKQDLGVFSYEAEFHVIWADKKEERFKTTFKATKVGKLSLKIAPSDVDLDRRVLSCRITNPAQSAELTIIGRSGNALTTVSETFNGAAAGSPLELSWEPVSEEIARLELKVTDVAGYYTGMHITNIQIEPWSENIAFGSGKARIEGSEEPKLQKTLTHIQKSLAEHGTMLTMKLFVAGYTDTVGGRQYNQGLSMKRARSVAQWLRRHGIKIPVRYQGFGEAALAKATPDETAEAANRRTVFILSSQTPPVSELFPKQNWQSFGGK